MTIACVALVGPANNPLYLRGFRAPPAVAGQEVEDPAARFHYIVYCALDVFEERMALGAKDKSGGGAHDMYLGLLYPTEEYRVYGYVTNSRVKLVLVVDAAAAAGEAGAKDAELRAVFRALHAAYVDAVANPFYTPAQPLRSPRFDAAAAALVAAASPAAAAAGPA